MSDIQGLLEKYKNIKDERFFNDIFKEREYKKALNYPSGVILDIGALAGEFGAFMYDKAQKIYAIEAYSAHYQELIDNIKEFNLDKIKPYHLAIAGENADIFLIPSSRGGHHISKNAEGETSEKITGKTLAQFINDEHINHVDMLKIDVEGVEDEIFKAPDFLSVADKISLIVGEHLEGVDKLLLGLGYIREIDGQNVYYIREKGVICLATYKITIVPVVNEKELTVDANNVPEALEAVKPQLVEGDVIKAVNPVE